MKPLSPRQEAAVRLLIGGMKDSAICSELGMSMSTLRVQLSRAGEKLGVPKQGRVRLAIAFVTSYPASVGLVAVTISADSKNDDMTKPRKKVK